MHYSMLIINLNRKRYCVVTILRQSSVLYHSKLYNEIGIGCSICYSIVVYSILQCWNPEVVMEFKCNAHVKDTISIWRINKKNGQGLNVGYCRLPANIWFTLPLAIDLRIRTEVVWRQPPIIIITRSPRQSLFSAAVRTNN